jgi:hypothetical protein
MLVLVTQRLWSMPGYPYRPSLVVGRIRWDACPQNEALTVGDVIF